MSRAAVNPALAGVALAVVLGAVVAGRPRGTPGRAVLGLVVTLRRRAAPRRSPAAARSASRPASSARVLAGYLLWIAARGDGVRTGGSRLGWPAEAPRRRRRGGRRLRQPRARRAGARAGRCPGGRVRARRAGRRADRQRSRHPAGRARAVLLLGGALLVRAGLGGTPAELEQLVTAAASSAALGRRRRRSLAVAARGRRSTGGFDLGRIGRPATAPTRDARRRAIRPIRR